MTVRHLDADKLVRNPAFTQVVSISGPVYVGGHNAVSASGEIIGTRVPGLANPDFLVEIDAFAAVPE